MKPQWDKATEGRVNPKGILCLYLSDDMKTAMTEVRPWVGVKISVAESRTTANLNVVDCSIDSYFPGGDYLDADPTPEQREAMAWWLINEALSSPITNGDDTADYAPTQIIAEAFSMSGADGIIYKSHLGTGRNIALFNLNTATVVERSVYRADAVEFVFSDPGDESLY